ncbi:MAG TPA: acyl-[ACP]--phospholipid O-acyltransferase [Thermogutta sp.]|nr:acyl-[ACP]--phospholipid O-acyltransferase [Thermogutta sp.]
MTKLPGDRHSSATAAGVSQVSSSLWSRSFLALLVTQFTVALNDNILRWLFIPIGKDLVLEQLKESPDVARSVGSFIFLLPFILLAGWAGATSDRFSKRTVIIGAKVAEIIVMTLAIVAILTSNVWAMAVVLFLAGTHSAFFSPSKYGSIPEIVGPKLISAANGVIGLTTMIAVIVGGSVGNLLYSLTTIRDPALAQARGLGPGQYRWWINAVVLLGVATLGWLTSLAIKRLPAADPQRRIPLNPFLQCYYDLKELSRHRVLLLAAIGSTYFWTLGLLMQLTIDKLAVPELVGPYGQAYVGPMLGILTLGIGLGSMLAGVWSHGRIERGLVPLGALGITVISLAFAFLPAGTGHWNSSPYFLACGLLFLLGAAAGLYDIPLISILQFESPAHERGRILAAYNFLSFTGMIMGSVIYWFLGSFLGLSARQMFVCAGIVTFPVFLIILYLTPIDVIRVLFGWLMRWLYRFRVVGLENVPADGPAIIVSNHLSWLDGMMIMLAMPRPIRMIAHLKYINAPIIRDLAKRAGVIAILPGAKSVALGIREARQALEDGELVGIFPEGGMTRTGQIRGFQPGFLKIARGLDVPIIPVYIDGIWGSIFTYSGGRYFWKWPGLRPLRVTLYVGQPLRNIREAWQAHLALASLGAEVVSQKNTIDHIPPRRFLRTARSLLWGRKIADSTGIELTGGRLLIASLALRRFLRRHYLKPDETQVGVLLPSSVAGVVTNAALALDRRIAVNLNYTLSEDLINYCIRSAGVKHVLTSRRMLERFPFKLEATVVFLEDIYSQLELADKLISAFQAYLLPAWVLERLLGLHRIDPDDVLTLIFTSGSTGRPKGVMLTHRNIGSNVAAFNQILHLRRSDVLCGILPFFHSFGYTTTLWTALQLKPMVVYHFSPLEPRPIGQICRKYKATILVATPTFLRNYVRRCEPEDFAHLEVVITGAEKLPPEVADAFEQKFGVRPWEGYGLTETSPVVSSNVPPSRVREPWFVSAKQGTVGRPIPGVAVKVVDVETGEDLGVGKQGMLLVKGPNVMKGYWNDPEQTAKVIKDGWYITGDLAQLDEDGFITITGRLSRFSKIAGEMVPHLAVEEAIGRIEMTGDQETITFAVTGVPDEKKGERLVVLYTQLQHTPSEICRALQSNGLPPLWVPDTEHFYRVDQIPVLGSGKLDLKALKEMAQQVAGGRD